MGTEIRPEISKKSKYWISRHRYYELKHFCMQYTEWKAAANDILLRSHSKSIIDTTQTVGTGSGVENDTIELWHYTSLMQMVEETAIQADGSIGNYILIGVTQGIGFTGLKLRYGMPCEKDLYFDRYRKFFWMLSMKRN